MDPEIAKLLNKQINNEFNASQFYLSASAWVASAQNLGGIAKKLAAESDEERGHGMKFYQHLLDRDESVTVEALAAPKAEWTSLTSLWEEILELEKNNTKALNKIADLALEKKDHATYSFLGWFITNQVAEEAARSDELAKVKAIDNSKMPGLIFHLEHMLK